MARLAIRQAGVWRSVGEAPEDPQEPTLPPGVQSYWQDNHPVQAGWELDPSVSKRSGIPPGNLMSPTSGGTISTGDQVIYDRAYTGQVNVNVSGVTFVRCTFTGFSYSPHLSPGNSLYLINGNGRPNFVDCEFYGANTISVYGGYEFVRCYFTEGNDILRVRHSGMTLIECVMDGCLRASSSSHTDAIQATNNSSSRYELYLRRCWINAYNRFVDDYGNAAIQSGAYGDPNQGGLSGLAEDCFFDGGNYMFNANGGHTDPKFVMRNNRIGRNSRYGVFSSSFASRADVDSSNVWADNLQPVTGG